MTRKKSGRRYTAEQKAEVIRRVEGGETQAAVAKATEITAWTVGRWVRAAKGGAKAGRKPVLPPGSGSARRPRHAGIGSRGVSWALDGDVLVLHVPLGRVARRMAALKVLAKIESELER